MKRMKLLMLVLAAVLVFPMTAQAAHDHTTDTAYMGVTEWVTVDSWEALCKEVAGQGRTMDACYGIRVAENITAEYETAPMAVLDGTSVLIDLNGKTIQIKETGPACENLILVNEGQMILADSSPEASGRIVYENHAGAEACTLIRLELNAGELQLLDDIEYVLDTNADCGIGLRVRDGVASVVGASFQVTAQEKAYGCYVQNLGYGMGDFFCKKTSIAANAKQPVGIFLDLTDEHDGGGYVKAYISDETSIQVNGEGTTGNCIEVKDDSRFATKFQSLSDCIFPDMVLVFPDGSKHTAAYLEKINVSNKYWIPGPSVEIRDRYEFESFHDVRVDDWYFEYAESMNEKGIMTGLSDGEFGPLAVTARAQFAMILYRMAGCPAVTADAAHAYPDVKAGAWYADAACWAKQEGYITGYDNGKFGPADPLTREQLVTILCRYSGETDTPATPNAFDGMKDGANVSKFARSSMEWAVRAGIIKGTEDHYLKPQGKTSRAECAAIIDRYIKM